MRNLSPAPGGLGQPQAGLGSTLRVGLGRAPLSLVLLAVLWVLGAGTGSLLHGPDGRLGRASLFEGNASLQQPLSLMLSLLWAPGLRAYLIGSVMLLTVGVFAEQRLGTARFAAALLTTHVAATAAVAVSGWLLGLVAPDWAHAFLSLRYGGPTAGLVGALMSASSLLTTLWRRRLRVGVVTLLATMVLYDGGGVSVLLLAAALAGMVLGRSFHKAGRTASPVGSIHESRMLAALVVGATAVGPLLAAATPNPSGPFAVLGYLIAPVHGPNPAVVAQLCSEDPVSAACAVGQLHLNPSLGAALMACLPALLLLVAADGLRRGRRMAWMAWMAALILEGALVGAAVAGYLLTLADAGTVPASSSVSDEQPAALFTRLLLPSLVPVAVAMVVLLAGRGLFTVRAPAGFARVFGRRVGVLGAACAGVHVGVGLLLTGQWSSTPTVGSLLRDFPLRLAPLELILGVLPAQLPVGPGARVLYGWTGVVFWSVTAVLAMRSFRVDAHAGGAGMTRARQLLQDHGGSSIAWMGLWPGNLYWFAPDGSSYVPYRVIHRVALTTGDPVGPLAERADAVDGFVRFCETRGWIPCFYSATRALQAECSLRGWRSVQIAEEAVLPLGTVAFTGKRFQDIRTTMNKAAREGVRVEWIDYPSAPRTTTTQIRAISEEWVAQQALPEMGFTLGGVEQLNDPQVRCAVVVDASGRVHAVSSWLPINSPSGQISGWTLDFMRRRSDGFNQGIELMIATAALHFQAQGYAVLSLSGAPLARRQTATAGSDPAETTEPEALVRLLDLVGTRLEPVYGFRSLMRFKAKFAPEYQPMFLLYADPTTLPTIARAVATAYVPTASFGAWVAMVNPRSRQVRTGKARGPGRRHEPKLTVGGPAASDSHELATPESAPGPRKQAPVHSGSSR